MRVIARPAPFRFHQRFTGALTTLLASGVWLVGVSCGPRPRTRRSFRCRSDPAIFSM